MSKLIMTLAGFIIFWAVVIFDVSVPTGNGSRVSNLGLMADRQNYLILGIGLFFVGLIMNFFKKRDSNNTLLVNSAKIEAPHEENVWTGEKNIENDSYKLYLVKKYSIEKNSTLEKFVIENTLFSTLEEALSFALQKEFDLDKVEDDKKYTIHTVKSTGIIGGSFTFTEFGDDTVEINHKSGFKKIFESMRETKEYFGEKS